MRTITTYIIFIILFCASVGSRAQLIYPVKTQANCSFPSVFLSDYYSPENFRVLVSLTDVLEPAYNVRLEVSFESNDISFSSINGIEVDLVGGQVYTLNEEDLRNLLAPSNLQGLNNASILPEGTYTISFTAYDLNDPNLVVSNARTDFTIANVIINEPPLLTQPANNTRLELYNNSQSVYFSWAPRSVTFSPSRPIKYSLKIVEFNPEERNAYDAINATVNLLNLETFDDIAVPAFIYDLSNYAFEPGKSYAWQVTAYEDYDNNGVDAVSSARFRNQGKSDVFTFTVAEFCPEPVLDPVITKLNTVNNQEEAFLNWTNEPEHTSYEIDYRPLGSLASWSIETITAPDQSLFLGEDKLARGTTYEYRIKHKCQSWQEAQYGGTFSLEAPECPAPEPIYIEENTPAGLALRWDKVEEANQYRVSYASNLSPELVTDPQIILPKLQENESYFVQVDALCDNGLEGEGTPEEVKFGDEFVVGECPLPEPFSLLSQRAVSNTENQEAEIQWSSLEVHESYTMTYWHESSPHEAITFTSLDPKTVRDRIHDNQLYRYFIEFTCKGGKKSTSPEGGFRIDDEFNRIDSLPGTGDCFPPSEVNAEVKSHSSARFEWKKVNGVEEYQLVYWIEGTEEKHFFRTTATSAVIDDLLPSATYQYQVQCRCGGAYSIFSEQGSIDLSIVPDYSNCDSIPSVHVREVSYKEVQLSWPYNYNNPPVEVTAYNIRFKADDQLWSESYPENLNNLSQLKEENLSLARDSIFYTVANLDEGIKYQFKIQAICGVNHEAEPNHVLEATTLTSDDMECGDENDCDRSIKDSKTDLEINDTIQVADGQLIIVDLVKTTHPYEGVGVMESPSMLGVVGEAISMAVVFDSLEVNTVGCVIDGNMEVTPRLDVIPEEWRSAIQQGMNAWDSLYSDFSEFNKGLQAAIDSGRAGLYAQMDKFQGGADKGFPVTGDLGNAYVYNGNISNANQISVDGTAVKVNGQSVGAVPVLIKDNEGEVYSVNQNGGKVLLGKYDTASYGDLSVLANNETVKLGFERNTHTVYGFDKWDTRYLESEYMMLHYLEGVDSKAILSAYTDVIDFNLSGGAANKLRFVNQKGFEYLTVQSNTLTITGGPEKDAQLIYALYVDGNDTTVVGKLLLSCYPQLSKKVVLVSVGNDVDINEAKRAKVEQTLNAIYGQAGLNYEVVLEEGFSYCQNTACSFSTSPSATLSNNYTGEEEALINAYKNHVGVDSLEEETAYLFMLPDALVNSNEQLQGKMNFGKQFGFLYDTRSKNGEALGHVLAHELGHGNFKFEHIFHHLYLGETARNDHNIMSYNETQEARYLNKLQWAIVHDPGVSWGIFEKDEEQQHVTIGNVRQLRALVNPDRETLTFATPKGGILTVPIDKLEYVQFYDASDQYVYGSGEMEGEFSSYIPVGTLREFKIDDKVYKYRGASTNGAYLNGSEYFKDEVSHKKEFDKVIVGFPAYKNEALDFYIGASSIYTEFSKSETNIPQTNYGFSLIGKRPNWDWLLDYLPSTSEKVSGFFSIEFSDDAVQALQTYVGQRELNGKEATALIRLVRLMNDFDHMFSCLNSRVIGDQSFRDYYNLQYINPLTIQQAQNRDVNSLEIFVPDLTCAPNCSTYVKDRAKLASKQEMIGFVQSFLSGSSQEVYEKSFMELVDWMEDEAKVIREMTSNASTLTDKIEVYKKGKNTCFFTSLAIEDRIKILNLYGSDLSNWDELLGTKETFFAYLIISTPEDDQRALYDAITSNQNNFGMLWGLYDEIDGSDCEVWVSAISSLHLKFNDKDSHETAPAFAPTKDIVGQVSWTSAINPVGIILDPLIFTKTGFSRNQLGQIKFFKTNADVKDVADTEWLNPMDYIDVTFDENWRFTTVDQYKNESEERIREGTYRLPAIFLYMCLNRQRTITNLAAVELVVTAAAVAATVASGGTLTPLLVAVEVGFAAVEISFIVSEDYIKSNWDKDDVILYNELKDVVDFIGVVDGGFGLVKTVSKGVTKYSFKLSEFVSNASSSGKLPQTKLGLEKIRDHLYNISANSFVTARNVVDFRYASKFIDFLSNNAESTRRQLKIVGSEQKLVFNYSGVPVDVGDFKVVNDDYVISVDNYNSSTSPITAKVDIDMRNGQYYDEFNNLKSGSLSIVKNDDGTYGVVESFNATVLNQYNSATKDISFINSDFVTNSQSKFVASTGDLGDASKVDDFEINTVKFDDVDYPMDANAVGKFGNSKCYIDEGFCFIKGTKILMANGLYKDISEIEVQNEVASHNHASHSRNNNRVTRLFKRAADTLTKLVIGGSTLFATPGHRIYANNDYIRAEQIEVGDSVLTAHGDYEYVESVRTFDTTATVYNFEVENDHNYYVTPKQLLVHNSCGWLTIKATPDLPKSTFQQFSNSLVSKGTEINATQRKGLYDAIGALDNPASRGRFVEDFATNGDDLVQITNDLTIVDAWKNLDALNPSSYVKRDVSRLEVFRQLSPENQNLFSQFTDVDANSTLSKFLEVIETNPSFLTYLNNAENSQVVRGMLAHKSGSMLTESELSTLGEMVNNVDEVANPHAKDWLTRSFNYANLRKYADEGTAFGNEMVDLWKSYAGNPTAFRNSELYQVLSSKIDNLEDYTVYSQVQLCLKGDCQSAGNYWIPDFVLVRKVEINGEEFFETIIVDAKRSRGTNLTKNQTVANGQNEWTIKSINQNNLVYGNKIEELNRSDVSLSRKGDFIKLFRENGSLNTSIID